MPAASYSSAVSSSSPCLVLKMYETKRVITLWLPEVISLALTISGTPRVREF